MERRISIGKTKVVRTFHPVGQGAFYTEKHIQGSSCINIVYDCGSVTGGLDWDTVINATFKEGEAIDLLFISHFHVDHVSGLEKLLKRCKTIKKVVIPFMKDEDKAFLKFFNFEATGGEQDYRVLIDDPQEFFGKETEILKVQSMEDENKSTNGSELKSGEIIKVDRLKDSWRFIPFNYDYGAKIAAFRKILTARGLGEGHLSTIEGILENKDEILKAYEEFNPTDLNEDSLVVFSGISIAPPYDDPVRIEVLNWNGYYLYQSDLSCLYLGDVNLNKPDFLVQLKERLKGYYDSVNTVQVPHHGSEKSFSIDILGATPTNFVSVITCGATRKKHPSGEVLKQIAVSGSTLFVVTEKNASKLVQEGEY